MGLFCQLICECNLQIGWDSVMRMSANLRDLFLYEAFLYYNPLLLVVSLLSALLKTLQLLILSTLLSYKIFFSVLVIADYDGLVLGRELMGFYAV